MKAANNTFFQTLSIFLFAFLFVRATPIMALPGIPSYQLAISFNLEKAILTGTAQIKLPAKETVKLDMRNLDITGIVVELDNGATREAQHLGTRYFDVPADDFSRTIYISYTKKVEKSHTNRIAKDGIALLSAWYPLPDKPVLYRLSAQLPSNFSAVTEADIFPLLRKKDTVHAAPSKPLDTLHFVAAPFMIRQKHIRDDLSVYTLFYPEDDTLAEDYLEKSKELILRYEKEIGPFPYNHYVVAANKLPTGLSMGSFSLFGQTVLRLPFIVNSSLGHEIVHAWFGSAVNVDLQGGNWCEGLTSYLADHAFRQDINEGEDYRKESIINYLSYTNPKKAPALSSFISATHSGTRDKRNRTIGYSRSMLLFHELRSLLGAEIFSEGIQKLYADYKGRDASWQNLRKVFEQVSGKELHTFFSQRLNRADIPDVSVLDAELESKPDKTRLIFTVEQQTDSPYNLQLPIQVTTASGQYYFTEDLNLKTTRIELELPERPLRFAIDPQYSMLRTLSDAEFIPTWSRFLGSSNKLVIIGSEESQTTYAPILAALSDGSWKVKLDSEVSNEELAQNDLLFLGTNYKSYRSLFGHRNLEKTGFSIEIRKNPLNTNFVTAQMTSSNESESQAVAHRLSHYGKYTSLHFEKGKLLEKKVKKGDAGITTHFEELPRGAAVPVSDKFENLVTELSRKDVIYIGESHTSVSDHRLQLRLIEALTAKVPQLAIGMEMFPASSQSALDDYTLGDGTMSEQSFLKQSKYFSTWNYDYRYFRDIFTLARQKKIPVIGLNLNKEIVSTVFRDGNTDQLDPDLQKELPVDRDLDLPGYGERLSEVYSAHKTGKHGMGTHAGFIQAQALWDETMARNISDYLNQHPQTVMVVLAGNQHTRNDSGIPPRVARRSHVRQASVLNLTGDTVPFNLDQVADYYFLSHPYELPESGKMGIILESYQEKDNNYIRIERITHASKAKEAGLKEGDTILSINDIPVSSIEDIKIGMLDARPGAYVTVKTRRVGITAPIHAKVELVGPQPPGHP